jgi:glucose/arabinose dehydrogenase
MPHPPGTAPVRAARVRAPLPGALVVLVFVAVLAAGCGRPAPQGSAATPGQPSTAPAGPTSATSPDPPGVRLALEPVATGLQQPLDIAVRPGDPGALFIGEQAGRVRVLRAGELAADPVLDIADLVTSGGEQGFLGLAFHPEPTDGRLFVYYTARDGQQVVASFRMDGDDPDRALPETQVMLLRMADQFGNHNGGGLAFGPDGYLYIATGDGGGGGDPLGSGRRLDTPLAKILRVDVDRGNPDGAGYAIPPDNPFVGVDGALPEIWHTGLRNPWRIRFDRATGDLWIGDVGQGAREEIDRASAGSGGLDFGWNLMEGFHCYPSGKDGCSTPDLTLPVAEYGHDQGCSVTGGTVYRGERLPALAGRYVFADYCSGRFWTLDAAAAATARQQPAVALDSDRQVSAIAEDAAGELFATDLASGEVLRIVLAPG